MTKTYVAIAVVILVSGCLGWYFDVQGPAGWAFGVTGGVAATLLGFRMEIRK